MLKKELLETLKDIAEDVDVNETIQNIEDFAKPLDLNDIGLEDYKKLIDENKTIQGYNQSLLDSAVSKGVESFKTKKMPTYIEEAIKAKSDEGKTPEQIKLQELEKQLSDMQVEKQKAELLNSNSGKLKEKGLDIGLAKYIQGEEDIEFFENLITNSINTEVNKKLNNNNYIPPNSKETEVLSGVEKEFFNRTGLKLD